MSRLGCLGTRATWVIIPVMQVLRRPHTLACFVLVWFVLSIGVAIASPIVKPQAMELICSASGAMKLLVKTDDGGKGAFNGHALDCPLCASTSAPPPVAGASAAPTRPPTQVLQSVPAARAASRAAAPLPARGPPTFS